MEGGKERAERERQSKIGGNRKIELYKENELWRRSEAEGCVMDGEMAGVMKEKREPGIDRGRWIIMTLHWSMRHVCAYFFSILPS